MTCRSLTRFFIAAAALVAASVARPAAADVTPAALFTDNMVLQRRLPDPVWGTASPGEKVTVSIAGRRYSTEADQSGKWMVRLRPLEAGGPTEMTIAGANQVTLKNVVVGEVWICSGQSNMEMGTKQVNNAAQEIAGATDPEIRLYTVPKVVAGRPQAEQGAAPGDWARRWLVCTPENVAAGGWGGFSAVAYFFGRKLRQELKVPIGLIHTSWGGTPAEAWTSEEALHSMSDYAPALEALDRQNADPANGTLTINQNYPTTLYNAMIAPLVPYGIRGAIWYQGESNAGKAYQYRTLLPTMIRDWRSRWKEGNFPFLIVQLANFMAPDAQPAESAWAELREAQSMTASSVPNTGQAVIIDIGDEKDIHPKDKQDVGTRLALIALARTYGHRIEYSGPTYRSMRVTGSKAVLTFDHVGGGLVTRHNEPLKGFAVAGADKHFYWADATIQGDTVVVSSPQVSEPAAVRYGWGNNPACNLYNKAGLPASPFRTDTWPGVTANSK